MTGISAISRSKAWALAVCFIFLATSTPMAFGDEPVGNLFGSTKGEPNPIIPASVIQEIVDNQHDKEEEKEQKKEEEEKEDSKNDSASSLQDMAMMFMMGYQMLQQLQGAEKQGIMGGQNDDGGCSGGGCSDGNSGGCSGGSCSAGGGGSTATGGGASSIAGGGINGGSFGNAPSILPNLGNFGGANLPLPNVVGGCANGQCSRF